MKKDTELRSERDRDLYAAYVRAVEEVGFKTEAEAADHARWMTAPRFYVGEKFCAEVMSRMERGLPPEGGNSLSGQKFMALFALYMEELPLALERGEARSEVCRRIVEMPAPSFFISRRRAMDIIRRERRRREASVGLTYGRRR